MTFSPVPPAPPHERWAIWNPTYGWSVVESAEHADAFRGPLDSVVLYSVSPSRLTAAEAERDAWKAYAEDLEEWDGMNPKQRPDRPDAPPVQAGRMAPG